MTLTVILSYFGIGLLIDLYVWLRCREEYRELLRDAVTRRRRGRYVYVMLVAEFLTRAVLWPVALVFRIIPIAR